MRSPVFTARTSGPTRVTSPQTHRFGAWAAVAGIRSPPRVLRSPSSGSSTTRRSPVKRMSGARERRVRDLEAVAFTMLRLSHAGVRTRTLVPCSPVNVGELLDRAVERFTASSAIDHWQRDRELIEAEDLLSHAMGIEELDREQEVPLAARRRF